MGCPLTKFQHRLDGEVMSYKSGTTLGLVFGGMILWFGIPVVLGMFYLLGEFIEWLM